MGTVAYDSLLGYRMPILLGADTDRVWMTRTVPMRGVLLPMHDLYLEYICFAGLKNTILHCYPSARPICFVTARSQQIPFIIKVNV